MLSDSVLLPPPGQTSTPASPAPLPVVPLSSQDWSSDEHPFRRRVNPHLADLLGRLRLDKRFVRGEGCYLYDEQGRRYLDCIAAYGALPFGFNPPEIWHSLHEVEAFAEPSFVQPSLLDAAGRLAESLLAIAPANLRYVTFTNSGAEAIEAAIKLCRAATGRLGILSTHNAFHGKTLGALSATGNPSYQEGFGAPSGEFRRIPYGDADALRRELTARPDQYAAFLVEPIQGEGGIVEPPPGYLAEVRQICSSAGVLLVFDEIQTGLGRTGTMFRCQADGVAPDVMTVAKALGGGLMPIGAVLSSEAAFSQRFALKHSSTFAGNTLACRAGLATLDLLTRDNGRLVERVARNGRRLKQRLEELHAQYPHLIAGIRGRGYMLGIELAVHRETWPDGVLGTFAEQGLFTTLFAAYLLNVERVRVAPTLNGNRVIRIEPALIFTWAHCEQLLAALGRALAAFSDGHTGRIVTAVLSGRRCEAFPPSPQKGPRQEVQARPGERRFAFLMHPLDPRGLAQFDPHLAALPTEMLEDLADRLAGLVDPFVLSRARVVSATGQSVYGEFIIVPWTAEQLAKMPRQQATGEVRAALDLAAARGAQMVGLGAYTSVVTRGGRALAGHAAPLTTGNSFTVVACAEGIRMALDRLGEQLGGQTSAAVVGATGAIGRAMALMLAESVGRLVLVGNPEGDAVQVRSRLLGVGADVCRHLAVRREQGHPFAPGSIGDRLVRLQAELPVADAPGARFVALAERLEAGGALVISQQADRTVPLAQVVVTATSAPGTLIGPDDLAPGAVVCDLSRPLNVSRDVALARPDVLVIDGGLIAVPGGPDLGPFGLDRGTAFACMAETMMLTLGGHLEDTSLGADLSAETLRLLRRLADQHGFRVARLRSFGRALEDADWHSLRAARQAKRGNPISHAA